MTITERQMMHKYIDIIKEQNNSSDGEAAHCIADRAIIDFLREVGFGDLAKAFHECDNKVGFYYS